MTEHSPRPHSADNDASLGYAPLEMHGFTVMTEGDLNQPLPGDAASAEITQQIGAPAELPREPHAHAGSSSSPAEISPPAGAKAKEADTKTQAIEDARENIRAALAGAGVSDEKLDEAKTIAGMRKIAAKHIPQLAEASKIQSRQLGDNRRQERMIRQAVEEGHISAAEASAKIAEIQRERRDLEQEAAEINAQIIKNYASSGREPSVPAPEPTPEPAPEPVPPPPTPHRSSTKLAYEPPVSPAPAAQAAAKRPVPLPAPSAPDADTTGRIPAGTVKGAETTDNIKGKLIDELDIIGQLPANQVTDPSLTGSRWYQNLEPDAQKALRQRRGEILTAEAKKNPQAWIDFIEQDQSRPEEARQFTDENIRDLANHVADLPLNTGYLSDAQREAVNNQLNRFNKLNMKARERMQRVVGTTERGEPLTADGKLPLLKVNADERAWIRDASYEDLLKLNPYDPSTYPEDMKAALRGKQLSPEAQQFLARYHAQAFMDRLIEDRTPNARHSAKNLISDQEVVNFLNYAEENNMLDARELAEMQPYREASEARLERYHNGEPRAPGDPPVMDLEPEKSASNPKNTAPVKLLSRDINGPEYEGEELKEILKKQGGLANDVLKKYISDIKGNNSRINIEQIGSLYLGGMNRAQAGEAFDRISELMRVPNLDADQRALIASIGVRMAHVFKTTEPYVPPVEKAPPTETQVKIHDWLHNQLGRERNGKFIDRFLLKKFDNVFASRNKEHIEMVRMASGDARALSEIAYSSLNNLSKKAQKVARRLLSERMAIEKAEADMITAEYRQRRAAERVAGGETVQPTVMDVARDFVTIRDQQLKERGDVRAYASMMTDKQARKNYLASYKRYADWESRQWGAALETFLNSPEVVNNVEVLAALDNWRVATKKATKQSVMGRQLRGTLVNHLISARQRTGAR